MRVLKALPVVGLSALSSLLALGGCTDDNSSIFISHVSVFEYEDGVGCSAGVDTALGHASLNVAFPQNAYVMPAVVASQLVRRDISTTAEPNGVHVQGAEVTVLNQAGQVLLDTYFVPSTSGVYIPPSAVGDISRAVVTFTALPPGAVQDLQNLVRTEGQGAQTIVLELRVLARTTGGTDIESAAFTFGISLYDDGGEFLCRTPENLQEFPALSCASGQDGLPYLDPC